jgi:putative phosphoesterase
VIAIVGDTHLPRGARRLPDRCVKLLRAASLIVHTGDVTSLAFLCELEALGDVAAVHGNVDEPELHSLLPATLEVEHEGTRIGVVHDGGPAAGRHERLVARFTTCRVVAYGHSHLPEIARNGETWIVNPGSPTERRRAPACTMAILEHGVPWLVQLD